MRAIVLAALAALTLSDASAQTAAPSAAEVVRHWRAAIGPATTAPSYSIYRSIEDGLPTTTERWVNADGSHYRKVVLHEFDIKEWLLAPDRAEMRDWNGFVREINGAELLRLRAEARDMALLMLGPPVNLQGASVEDAPEPPPGLALRTTSSGGVATTWLFDQTGIPRASITSDDNGEPAHTTYTWADHARGPASIVLGEGEDAIRYERADLPPSRTSRDAFAPLRAGPSDVVMHGDAVVLPFTMEANHIVLQARLNGHDPIGFLLDTGDSENTINAARMESFGLSGYGSSSLEGGGNAAASSFTRDVTLDIGAVQLRSQHASVLDLSGLERAWGVPVGGILGYDFLSRFVVEIDYQAKVMTLHRPERWRYHGNGAVVPITFDEGLPYADAFVSVPTTPRLPARILVDFGLADTMVFTRPYVEANDLARLASGNPAAVNATAGLDNQFFAQHNTRGRIDMLEIGALSLSGLPVNFSTNTTGAYSRNSFAATMGNTVFSRYHVFIDYQRNRIYFEHTAEAATPFADRRTFGLTLLAGGDDLRTFTVSGVRDGSPAAAAGFQRSDVIAAIDDRTATEFTLGELRDLVLRNGEHHVFHVRRGEQTLDITADITTVSIER